MKDQEIIDKVREEVAGNRLWIWRNFRQCSRESYLTLVLVRYARLIERSKYLDERGWRYGESSFGGE